MLSNRNHRTDPKLLLTWKLVPRLSGERLPFSHRVCLSHWEQRQLLILLFKWNWKVIGFGSVCTIFFEVHELLRWKWWIIYRPGMLILLFQSWVTRYLRIILNAHGVTIWAELDLKWIWICVQATPKQALGHPGNQVSVMCPCWEYCSILLWELHRRICKLMQVKTNLDFHSYHHSWCLCISIFKNDRFCCLSLCVYFTFLSEINMLKKTCIAYNYY